MQQLNDSEEVLFEEETDPELIIWKAQQMKKFEKQMRQQYDTQLIEHEETLKSALNEQTRRNSKILQQLDENLSALKKFHNEISHREMAYQKVEDEFQLIESEMRIFADGAIRRSEQTLSRIKKETQHQLKLKTDEISNIQNKITVTDKQIAQLKQKLIQVDQEQARLRKQLDSDKLLQLKERLDSLVSELGEITIQKKQSESERDKLIQDINEQMQVISDKENLIKRQVQKQKSFQESMQQLQHWNVEVEREKKIIKQDLKEIKDLKSQIQMYFDL